MIEIRTKPSGETWARLTDGVIQSAPNVRRLLRRLALAGVAEQPLRIYDGETFVQYCDFAAAERGVSAKPAPEYTPRGIGQHYGGAEIWDAKLRRWIRPVRRAAERE